LPHPNVHWVFQQGRGLIHGVHSGRFVTTLSGRDGVFGVKFRAGAFRAFLGRSVSTLRDRSILMEEVFGGDSARLARELMALDPDDAAMVDAASRFLLARLPVPDAQADWVARIVDEIAADRNVLRVEQLLDRYDTSKRTLQRSFHDYVGIGPKWVIERFRMHEAVERLANGDTVDLTRLALDLGYFDQAHFGRAFKALIGRSPREYLGKD
jgi:AraC-like DNA-binding protein